VGDGNGDGVGLEVGKSDAVGEGVVVGARKGSEGIDGINDEKPTWVKLMNITTQIHRIPNTVAIFMIPPDAKFLSSPCATSVRVLSRYFSGFLIFIVGASDRGRSSCTDSFMAGELVESPLPQKPQNLAHSGFSFPQDRHFFIPKDTPKKKLSSITA
jgi:hypothetical protein